MNTTITTQVVIIGSGPSGYTAAFRSSDLGLKTVLIEQNKVLGGVCLNVGCIPSKAFLNISKIFRILRDSGKYGIKFDNLSFDINKIHSWKEHIINKLNQGLISMANKRKIEIVHGLGKFISNHSIEVKNNKTTTINFENAIIATGSKPIKLTCANYDSKYIWDSTDALKLQTVPKNMLIIGGGAIGLEIATIYQSMGSNIDILEESSQLINSIDDDLSTVFIKSNEKRFNFILNAKIISVDVKDNRVCVSIEQANGIVNSKYYDVILVAIGRKPYTEQIGIDSLGIKTDKDGFIIVDEQLRTNIPNIYAIGDVIGRPMLAHKGIYEGRVVAEIISGENHYFDPKVIPCIIYTDPEISWVGLTEKQAKAKNINHKVAIFPWSASGRAVIDNCTYGFTKLIFSTDTRRIIGGAIVGNFGSSELLGEISLAIEMGCDVEDIALTIHSHPTFYESIGIAAEIFNGSATDLLNPTGIISS